MDGFHKQLLLMLAGSAVLTDLAEGVIPNPLIAAGLMTALVRGAALEVMQRDYVTAAVAAGCGRLSIAVRHVLPNVLSPVVVLAALRIGTVITHLASFSFLGLGAQPPAADWGVMLSDCRPYLSTRPLMILWPGAAIMSSVLAFHLFGEGLNAALHPRREGGTSDD